MQQFTTSGGKENHLPTDDTETDALLQAQSDRLRRDVDRIQRRLDLVSEE